MLSSHSFKLCMSIEQQINPAVLLIATRKYTQFLPNIVRKLDRWFMPNREIAVVIFSDQDRVPRTTMRTSVVWTRIEDYKWPYATLYRYKIFSSISRYLLKFSHLYYMDVDMDIVSEIGDEFLTDGLLAVRHPGFSALGGWGSEGNHPQSLSEFPKEHRKNYYAGGVQGGAANVYIDAAKELSRRIDEDEKSKIISVYHDETHWNKYCNFDKPELVTEFDSGYCMVQSDHLRRNWKIDNLPVKIIALDKNHAEIRS